MKTKLVYKPTMKNGNQQPNDQRKGRKNKKHIMNEVLEFYSEYDNDQSHYTNSDIQLEYKHSSAKTKREIDEKFTKPKNKSQEIQRPRRGLTLNGLWILITHQISDIPIWNITHLLKKKIENVTIKKLIVLIFFFLPGGFFLLSIMMVINELFLNNSTDETSSD